MNCSKNCNQGRNCSCGPVDLRLPIILLVVALIAITAVIELLSTGSAHWTEFAVVALVVVAAFGYVVYWLAGKAIAAIDFMTRCE